MKELRQINERLAKLESLATQQYLSIKKVLTFNEALAYTGRSESNMYKLTSDRLIPHSKPGKKLIYFDREKLDAWLLQNPVKTVDNIESEAATYMALNRKSA